MMGKQHFVSGATAWVAGCAVCGLAGYKPPADMLVIGATVCSIGALLPDIDHPRSMAANGPKIIARHAADAAASVRRSAYRSARQCRGRKTGTRDVWKTLALSTYLVQGMVLAVGWALNWFTVAVAHLIGWTCGHRGPTHALPVIAAVTAAMTGAAMALSGARCWWVGAAIGAGAVAHVAGDWLTEEGVPVPWSLGRRGGPRWSAPWTFHAGDRFETSVVRPVLMALMVGAGVLYTIG